MNLRKLIGYTLVASPFVYIFYMNALMHGLQQTIWIFLVAVLIMAAIVIGVNLILD